MGKMYVFSPCGFNSASPIASCRLRILYEDTTDAERKANVFYKPLPIWLPRNARSSTQGRSPFAQEPLGIGLRAYQILQHPILPW